MSVTKIQRPARRDVLPVASTLLGVGYYIWVVSVDLPLTTLGIALFYSGFGSLALSSVAIPAIAVRYGYDRPRTFLLGLLPSAGMALGYSHVGTRVTQIYPLDSIRFILVFWIAAIPLVTLGFVSAAGWKYRGKLRERRRYLLIPAVLAALATLALLGLLGFTDWLLVDRLN